MSAIQLLESIAVNSEHKSKLLSGSENTELTREMLETISELDNTKMWCAFVPAKEDEPSEGEESPSEEDNGEEKSGDNISVH